MSLEYIIPPHHALKTVNEKLGIDYAQWLDDDDCDHVTGAIAKDRHGAWVTKPGFRLNVVNGEINIYRKVSGDAQNMRTKF